MAVGGETGAGGGLSGACLLIDGEIGQRSHPNEDRGAADREDDMENEADGENEDDADDMNKS